MTVALANQPSRQRILISGGAGYVGRTLTRLLYNDHDVCVADTLSSGPDRFSAAEMPYFQLRPIDICDAPAITAVIEEFRPDVIIHLAAIHFIPYCEQNPGKAVETNVTGTVNLLAACQPGCRFVFASSAAVYSPSSDLHDELGSQVGPQDVYGWTKWQGENFVRYFAASRNFPAVITRLFNVVGPGETNPHLLPEIVAQVKAGHLQIRLGNLWPKRDYIHVSDAAAGFAATALTGHVAAGEVTIVNLGTSKQYSVGEMLDRLRAISGRSIVVEQDPTRVRAVDRPYLGANIRKIKRQFDWSPTRDIDTAIADLWLDSSPLPNSLTGDTKQTGSHSIKM
jgi:UDP-glucose 4-epimerase